MLMLLQARRRMTAGALAEELEVSVRTIYRDMDALSAAGVPVYAERGPGGGCSLLDDYRTTLTGLTKGEIRALLMLGIPAPLAELGADRQVEAALRKLVAALPVDFRGDEERVRQRIHLDSLAWSGTKEPAPHLRTVQRAIWEDRRLRLVYRLPFGTQVERVVDPYGLVAKASVWHLVCARKGHVGVRRVSDIVDAHLLDGRFRRPAQFDLVAYWRAWCAQVEENRPSYYATVSVAPDLVPWLSRYFGVKGQVSSDREPRRDKSGWQTMTLHFESLEDARERILGFGGAVQVLGPRSLRESVLDFAEQIVGLYGE
jgi:predicted DNA-binding transcriptional regulator YafY